MSIPIDYFKSIKWPEFLKNRHLRFKGRNGYVNCLGVEINKGLATDSIRITALNSRGWGESCWVEIPEEKRLDVCLAMVPELKDLIRAVPDEALPSLPSSLDTLVEQRIRGKREVYSCPKCGWESFCDDDYDQNCPQTGCDGKLTEIRTEEYEK